MQETMVGFAKYPCQCGPGSLWTLGNCDSNTFLLLFRVSTSVMTFMLFQIRPTLPPYCAVTSVLLPLPIKLPISTAPARSFVAFLFSLPVKTPCLPFRLLLSSPGGFFSSALSA